MSEKIRKVVYKGSMILAEVTPDGLYVCPICSKALFATAGDLMHHILAHARGYTSRMVKIIEEEEEEEEEES